MIRIPIERYELENGMQVVLSREDAAPVVALNRADALERESPFHRAPLFLVEPGNAF